MPNAPHKEKVTTILNVVQGKLKNIDQLPSEQIDVLVNSIHTFLCDLEKLVESSYQMQTPKLDATNYFPSEKILSECIGILLRHLNSHVDEFSLCLNRVDHYKVAAWLGCALIRKTKDKHPNVKAEDVVMTLAAELESGDGKTLNQNFLNLIINMLKNDGIKNDHGIGMNGLYLIFRASSEVKFIQPHLAAANE